MNVATILAIMNFIFTLILLCLLLILVRNGRPNFVKKNKTEEDLQKIKEQINSES